MWRFSRRRLLHSYLLVVVAWSVLIVFMQMTLGGWSPLSFMFGHTLKLNRTQLMQLMEPAFVGRENATADVLFHDPLLQLLAPHGRTYHLFDLPKRKPHVLYGEITSANRDSRYPLAPDFTFHVEYSAQKLTLYEDYGPGCIFRIFIYPHLPTSADVLHRMTSKNLSNLFLSMEVDGTPAVRYSLQKLSEADNWPFVFPLSARHPSPSAGIGGYTPFCYSESMRIWYEHDTRLPENLLELTINCTANELLCPVHVYSAVSRHRYPVGMFSSSMAPVGPPNDQPQIVDIPSPDRVIPLLANPELYGPSAGHKCRLSCVSLCPGCQHIIYNHIMFPRVITSLRVRVLINKDGIDQVLEDWNGIFLSAYFDDFPSAHFHRIPLGSLFGATGSLNDFRGAAFGKRSLYCDYDDRNVVFDRTLMTGYFYFPMPYWREALIVVQGAEHLQLSVTVCWQFTEVRNYYKESETGYLNAVKTYYSDDVRGWRSALDIGGGWGSIVGLSMEIDNLRAIRDVPLAYRWAALQSDMLVYIDDDQSATVLGTGLEDYFSYAHGFAGAENTTYSFVGVHHAGPKRSEPLTWHCYRQHVLDPITFESQIRFAMEGTDATFYTKAAAQLTYEEHRARLIAQQPSLSHLVFYYFRPHTVNHHPVCDKILFSNSASEKEHSFVIVSRTGDNSGRIFNVVDARFLGDTTHNQSFSASGRVFRAGDKFAFTLRAVNFSVSSLYRIRRTFHLLPRQWNDRARWSVNDIDHGVWFYPMGSLATEFSLVTDDRTILGRHAKLVESDGQVRIEIQPLSALWNDISYELCPVLD